MFKPFVTLKLAQTLDGCIATASGDSKWITSEDARRRGHFLRAQSDAILVGAGTVRADDPELSVRYVLGNSPTKIVLDSRLEIPVSAKIFVGAPLIVACGEGVSETHIQSRQEAGAQVWQVPVDTDGKLDLNVVMRRVFEAGLAKVLIEGGSQVAASALKAGLVDRVAVFVAPKILGSGLSSVGSLGIEQIANAIALTNIEVERIGDDVLYTANVKK